MVKQPISRRGYIRGIGTAGIVSVAGCASDKSNEPGDSDNNANQTDNGEDDNNQTDGGNTTDEVNSTEGTDDTEQQVSDEISTEYEFSDGELYEYQYEQGSEGDGEMMWGTSVYGDDVNVSYDFEQGSMMDNGYASGKQGDIFQKAISKESIRVFLTYAREPVEVASGQNLEVGSEWQVDRQDLPLYQEQGVRSLTYQVEVTGKDSVNNIDCTNISVSTEEVSDFYTACVTPDYPFVLAYSNEEIGIGMTLLEATRP